MWYTITLLTGIQYGTGQRTVDISLADSVHAMRCWWLYFLAYASTITLAKLSLGFFFLRLTSIITLHRIVTVVTTASAVLIGVTYFFLSLFQCTPIDLFWTRLQGAQGKCISMDVIMGTTYLYGAIAAATDIAFGVLLSVLVWRLKVERKTKLLIAPLLGLACIASYAALVRMPYVSNFRSADFLFGTVDVSLWSTVEVGVSVVAANAATLRPLVQHVQQGARVLSSRVRGLSSGGAQSGRCVVHELREVSDGKSAAEVQVDDVSGSDDLGHRTDGDSTISLVRSTRQVEA
ncbi:hypothetical protein EKO04_011427 [Ascochyta lentis]|uniref:Rhodopsin domain-containing protein n=1 Tax=Ascochyta lentis TaxID=205686 RepID=A0A8H7IS79_9PLEO|nr:hypothetical protein EKO04_011427 [Ascochyta lentis]